MNDYNNYDPRALIKNSKDSKEMALNPQIQRDYAN